MYPIDCDWKIAKHDASIIAIIAIIVNEEPNISSANNQVTDYLGQHNQLSFPKGTTESK